MSAQIETAYATILLVINRILTVPFRSYRRLLFKFWTLCIFEPSLYGLGATYTVHLTLIGKRIVDFLFVLIELFLLDFTADGLRANIDWKSAQLKGVGQFRRNFYVVGDVLRESILHGIVNALQLCR